MFSNAVKVNISITKSFSLTYFKAIFGFKENEYTYTKFSIGNFISMIFVFAAMIFTIVRPFLKKLNEKIWFKYIAVGLLIISGILLFFTGIFTVVDSKWTGGSNYSKHMTNAPIGCAIFLFLTALCVVAEDVVKIILERKIDHKGKVKVKKIKGRS